jgi:hypothetical protein
VKFVVANYIAFVMLIQFVLKFGSETVPQKHLYPSLGVAIHVVFARLGPFQRVAFSNGPQVSLIAPDSTGEE